MYENSRKLYYRDRRQYRSEKDVLDAFRVTIDRFKRNHGRIPSSTEYRENNFIPSFFIIRKFGLSWESALEKIGYKANASRGRPKKYSFKDALEQVIKVMHENQGKINSTIYIQSKRNPSYYHIAANYGWKKVVSKAKKIYSLYGANVKPCASPECDNLFPVTHHRRMYCTPRCRDREKRRRYWKERRKKWLYPQCGGKMDYPESLHSTRRYITYCSSCREYFKKRYKKK